MTDLISAINQTIALKTIEKLGFTATAVWNGAEALSYLSSCLDTPRAHGSTSPISPPLLTPSSAAAANPMNSAMAYQTPRATPDPEPLVIPSAKLPSIILMDVQMPVMDGYSATKILRTQAPFKDNEAFQRIPIVALTASAIQGDMEKCLEAGMNDYLAKPVGGKVLERMLVKWGVNGGP